MYSTQDRLSISSDVRQVAFSLVQLSGDAAAGVGQATFADAISDGALDDNVSKPQREHQQQSKNDKLKNGLSLNLEFHLSQQVLRHSDTPGKKTDLHLMGPNRGARPSRARRNAYAPTDYKRPACMACGWWWCICGAFAANQSKATAAAGQAERRTADAASAAPDGNHGENKKVVCQ